MLTPEREQRIKSVIGRRQEDLCVILENVHDPHNIGAVLRTCDSVGICEVYILYNSEELTPDRLYIGPKSASGAIKWVDVHFYKDTEACYTDIRKKYKTILGTHLDSQAEDLYNLDMNQSLALVFGNEHLGLTEASLRHLDGNFTIPQWGMVQSLNISVACAVTLYEASRQRISSGKYNLEFNQASQWQTQLFERYLSMNKVREKKALKSRNL